GDTRWPDDRLIFVPDELGQRVEKLIATYDHFMVLRIQVLCDGSSVREFAVTLLSVSDREAFDRLAANLGHQGGDSARVEATAQEHAERNVAHQMATDCLLQQVTIGLNVIVGTAGTLVRSVGQVPVVVDAQFAVNGKFQSVSPQKLADTAIKRLVV